MWTKTPLYVKLGSKGAGVVAGVHICPDPSSSSFAVPLCSGGKTHVWHNAKCMSVCTCPDRLYMISDPWCPISCSTPKHGKPFFCTLLGKAECLAKTSPSLAHDRRFCSAPAVTQTGMWPGHASKTFISFTSRRFPSE